MRMVHTQQPTANGVTYSNTGGTACYAEFGMTGSNGNPTWQTCLMTGRGALQNDGVTATILYVLPPGATAGGATDTSQAVTTQTTAAADKGLGFTAAATGDFTARVEAIEGSGPVTLTATAVGTAEHRSPPLRADGRPHPLEVSCYFSSCTFGYDGATVYDGDGSGFDLVRDCFGLTVATCSSD
jgi:hypothetical protein